MTAWFDLAVACANLKKRDRVIVAGTLKSHDCDTFFDLEDVTELLQKTKAENEALTAANADQAKKLRQAQARIQQLEHPESRLEQFQRLGGDE